MGQSIVSLVETVTPPAAPDQNRCGPRPRRPLLAGYVIGGRLAVATLFCLGACHRAMVVGEYQCPESNLDDASPPSSTDPVSVPWQTGFENGACDYQQVSGFCYRFPPAVFRVVTSPVHTGQYAAEITIVTGTDAGAQPQGRCVRQGVLPPEAYYGAWFYVPKPATNNGLWNLMFLQGGNADTTSIHALWNVSLVNDAATGELTLLLQNRSGTSGVSPPIPVGRWFHVVFYLKRAKDESGVAALYLDEQKVVELANLVTDDSDWAQWYVGNLADDVSPPECTVYVDDVTIRSTL